MTDDTSPTYDWITERLSEDDEPYASLFGYTLQMLKMVTDYPRNVAMRQQAQEILRAVNDHDAKRNTR